MNRDIDKALSGAKPDTLAVRAGQCRTGESTRRHCSSLRAMPSKARPRRPPVSAATSRAMCIPLHNPTVRNFERRIAVLEGAEDAVATSSGMAAVLSTCMALLKAGDHVVCSRSVFGATISLFGKYMEKFGVEVSFVSLTDIDEWRAAIKDNTACCFWNAIQPALRSGRSAALSKLARSAGALLAVDNCFCTPALQRPLELGADIVVHSATKYQDGQGRWCRWRGAGSAAHMEEVLGFLRSCRADHERLQRLVFLKGLETQRLRMEAHSSNAMILAQWLREQKQVEAVFTRTG